MPGSVAMATSTSIPRRTVSMVRKLVEHGVLVSASLARPVPPEPRVRLVLQVRLVRKALPVRRDLREPKVLQVRLVHKAPQAS